VHTVPTPRIGGLAVAAGIGAGTPALWAAGGERITQLDVPLLDSLLLLTRVSFAFTLFAVAAVTHAINVIDGLNGLSGANWILGAAWAVGDAFVAAPASILADRFRL
jgi:UDP-N-acetylmuramyl pentapeptide phosphotransferase/UDP-N-acetylglucosamine-1-phosphate transferase